MRQFGFSYFRKREEKEITLKRLIFITTMVLFIFSVNAFGGEAIITGQYKGFTLIKADWRTVQDMMEERGFSRYVVWSAFTDFKKRQVWYTEDFVEGFLERIPLIRRIHVTPLDHELKCIDDIKYRIKTAIKDREIQQEVAFDKRNRGLFE
jgi:hypothetical protein